MEKQKNGELSRMFGYAGKFHVLTVLGCVLSGISTILSMLPFVCIWLVIRDLIQAFAAGDISLATGSAHYAWMAVVFAAASILIYFIALNCTHLAAFRTATNMRKSAIHHIVTLPLGYFSQNASGRLRNIIDDNAGLTEGFLAHQLPDLTGAAVMPVAVIILIFLFDWRLGICCLIPMGISVIFLKQMMGGDNAQFMGKYMTALETMNKEAVEYIRGIPVVKVFQQTIYSFKNFHAAIEEYEKFASGYALKCRIPLTGFTVTLNGTFVLLIPVAMFILSGVSGQAAYENVVLDFLFYSLFTPVCATMMNRIMFASEQLMAAKSAVSRVDEILQEKPLKEPEHPLIPADASIVFSDVSFAYPGAKEKALDHISFEVPTGKTVALVGASGSGKSTAASLIPRFYDVQSGSVTIGGVNVRNIEKQELMKRVAFVFQNTCLFKDTLLNNIKAARPDATREEVLKAADEAQCKDIIDRLPDGLDTLVGTGGTYLSGGENQRIALARAILKDAPIIVLDEATAFADAENEHQIQLAFERLTQNKTVMMIAHRLSTIQDADLILVFKEGQIAERGTHEELVALMVFILLCGRITRPRLPGRSERRMSSMIKALKKKYALSDQGAKDLLKGIVYSVLANISLMFPVILLAIVLNQLLAPVLGASAPEISAAVYTVIGIVILAVVFIFHYCQYTATYLGTYDESARRRIGLAEKLRTLPLTFFHQRDLADLTSTIMGDCANFEHAFSHTVPQFFGAVISTGIVCIGLLIFNWQMGLALLWVAPISFAIVILSRKWQEKLSKKHMNARLELAEGIQECLETVQDIKACNQEEDYLRKLDAKMDAAEKAQISSEMTTASLLTTGQMFLRLGLATVIVVGNSLVVSGDTSLFTYILFLIAASRLYDPLSGAMSNMAELFSVQLQVNRLKEIEEYPEETGEKNIHTNGYDITFDHVQFSYEKGKPVLRDVSFTAKQGQVTALVGPSGGGKSTVAKLAAKFYPLDGGRILLGGTDIAPLNSTMLMKNFSIVFQDVVLFNNTIMENIRVGKKDATDEEVIAAAKAAQCDEFISKLSDGYQTVIGENGSTLSGGECQRLSIARALLKDAPVILLDEATASLDVDNETEIQNAISRLVKGKTVLIIAHRMRTVEAADNIVVLSDGIVAENGTHEELMKENGLYHRLVDLQTASANWKLSV